LFGCKGIYLGSTLLNDDRTLLLMGTSQSPRGGLKSEDSRNVNDFWTIALDTNGVSKWDKTIGSRDYQNLSILQEVKQGSYVCSGVNLIGLVIVKINHKKMSD